MSAPYAKVIADSTYDGGVRLTTMEVRFHRFVLPQFNAHRVFSRNSASSRAIPVQRQVAKLNGGLAMPLSWPQEKQGMQGGVELPDVLATEVRSAWMGLSDSAITTAESLRRLGLHKSVTNRVLEPYIWHTVVVTATAWDNFFAQRSNALAQPEIRAVSEAMEAALARSTPQSLTDGQWHLPYVQDEDVADINVRKTENWIQLAKVSAARCARTSYLTQDGVRDLSKDLELYNRLINAKPAHWSPLEHVATPWADNRATGELGFKDIEGRRQVTHLDHLPRVGNLLGWRSLRIEVETAQGARTYC